MRITKENSRLVVLGTSIFLAISVSSIGTFYFGYQKGLDENKNIVIQDLTNTENKEPIKTNFGIFWEAWDLLKNEHLKGATAEDQKMVYGAIQGLVNSLGDPNTVFFPPEDSKKFEEDVTGNFGGIGAEIGVRKDQLTVISPLKESPAEKAGIKAGDLILAINEKNSAGLDVNEAVKKIRGEIGTEVSLTILREGWDNSKEFKIMRANIEIPTLEWSSIQKDGKQLAQLKLFSFNQNAPLVFYKGALKVLLGRSDGLILDLRNNPGGFLEVAVNLAGWFLEKGDLVAKEKFRNGQETEFRANGNGALKNIPTIILVNKGSASASEILAGALRAHNPNIKLVGTQTFGKGTVQELKSLSDDSKIKLTIANWELPDGTIIDENGIKPDVEIEIKEDPDADPKNPKDPQLDKAIEILLEQIKTKVALNG
ncbi:MAG: S41 family peptidase [bacterium]|nr:S41 family peptidase [bacterium]